MFNRQTLTFNNLLLLINQMIGMTSIDAILAKVAHRPYPLPPGFWRYYQEWNQALFLHWAIPVEVLRPLVPHKLQIDTFDQRAYVSLVAFTMQHIRPRGWPSLPIISNFSEINVRTYVEKDAYQGVFFLNIEAGNRLSAFLARQLSGLPYEQAHIQRTNHSFQSMNKTKGFYLDTTFDPQKKIKVPTALDHWLTERYCLFLDHGRVMYRYDIHHQAWRLIKINMHHLQVNYHLGEMHLNGAPDLMHYAEGVKVLAWPRQDLNDHK